MHANAVGDLLSELVLLLSNPFMAQSFFCAHSVCRIKLQKLADEILEVLIWKIFKTFLHVNVGHIVLVFVVSLIFLVGFLIYNVLIKRHLRILSAIIAFSKATGYEGHLTTDQDIGNDTKGPHVSFEVVFGNWVAFVLH